MSECKECNGEKKVLSKGGMADDMDICPACHGTGQESTGEGKVAEGKEGLTVVSPFTQLSKKELLFICEGCKHANCITDADINGCKTVGEYKAIVRAAKIGMIAENERELKSLWEAMRTRDCYDINNKPCEIGKKGNPCTYGECPIVKSILKAKREALK